LPRTNVDTYTMPGFGTTRRTKNNATKLCQASVLLSKKWDIVRTSRAHLKDLGHEDKQDVVFENVQARYRTEFLSIKLTSLKALLSTGDHHRSCPRLEHFRRNHISPLPHQCVRAQDAGSFLVRWVPTRVSRFLNTEDSIRYSRYSHFSDYSDRRKARLSRRVEEIIGPVELADFYLYPFIRFGMRPGRILYLA